MEQTPFVPSELNVKESAASAERAKAEIDLEEIEIETETQRKERLKKLHDWTSGPKDQQ